MTTIVRWTRNGETYVLLGAGLGAFKSARPSFFLGNLAPTEESGLYLQVAICADDGSVGWVRSNEVEVISVDGQSPAEALAPFASPPDPEPEP